MTSEPTAAADRLDALLLEVLARPPGDRAAFLDLLCRDDDGLRRDLEGLLAAHERAGDFLERPAVAADATVGTRLLEGPGTVIGRYKLLQLIGEGGFGAVYMAEQREPVKRKVALKIIKLGMDTKQVIARFEAERQALALMDHPNIARVLDAGATETGRPFFVMELVKGIPITEYCDKNNLSTDQRLDLFVDVCHAVQHAHQKGIIHRDIKPSNVLLTLHDGRPVPKVIDFGIAKATNRELTDKTLFTEFRQFVGTPEYMSPEQAEMSGLDIDTRTDIYALGVLLYELLTGTTPFDAKTLREAGYGEIRRIIREREPDRPSTRLSTMGDDVSDVARHRHTDPGGLRRQLRGDLDWIVMKAIEKDRTRRYDTANGLAMDVTRYQVNEPVLATPPSAAYRLRKFVRRNRGAVTGGGVIAAALVLGLAAASFGFVQARRERNVAQAEAAKAAAVAGFLEDMLASMDPGLASGREFTVVSMLDDAGTKLDGGALDGQPEIEASLRATIGGTYQDLGLLAEAAPHLRQAVDIRTDLLGPDDPDTHEVMEKLYRALKWQGRYEEARPVIQALYDSRRRTLGEDHADTLRAMYLLAWNTYDLGDPDRGSQLHQECLARRRRASGEDHPDTATSWNCTGLTYLFRGKYDEAEPYVAKAYEIGVRALGEDHPSTLIFASNLASVYKGQGRYDEAEAILDRAIPVSRRVLGPTHDRTVGLIRKLTGAYAAEGRLDEARPWTVELIAAHKSRCERAPSSPDVLDACASLLLACEPEDLRDPAGALRISTKCNVLTDYRNPDYLQTLARACATTGDAAHAIEYQRQAIALLPPEQPDRAEFEERLSGYLEAQQGVLASDRK